MKGKRLHEERKREMLGRHIVNAVIHSSMLKIRHSKTPLSYILREGRGLRHK